MAYVRIQTPSGPKKVRVCDYCKAVCIPAPASYCSGKCAREAERALAERFTKLAKETQ